MDGPQEEQKGFSILDVIHKLRWQAGKGQSKFNGTGLLPYFDLFYVINLTKKEGKNHHNMSM